MVEAEFFDKLEAIARWTTLRGNLWQINKNNTVNDTGLFQLIFHMDKIQFAVIN